MKKGIVVTVALCAAAAWAADLNPSVGRAQGTGNDGNYPWLIHLKVLWPKGDVCGNINWVWANDDNCWNYADPNDPTEAVLYQVFKFERPAGYDAGTLRWRIWGNSGNQIKIWRWNDNTDVWVNIDSYAGGVDIPLQTLEPVQPGWFYYDDDYDRYYLYLMATVAEGATTHNIIADICDIQWY